MEVAAEAFYNGGLRRLQSLARGCPLILYGQDLSLGSPIPFEPHELARFAATSAAANPLWLKASLGFSRVPGTNLGLPTPTQLNEASLSVVAEHALQVMDACCKRLLLRNIAGYLQFASSMPEPEFMNRLCERTGCGLCLDLTSLYVNSRNHLFDPRDWLAAIAPTNVVQIQIGGCRQVADGWQVTHDRSPCADVLALAEEMCVTAPVQAAVLDRHAGFPPVAELVRDLDLLRQIGHVGVC